MKTEKEKPMEVRDHLTPEQREELAAGLNGTYDDPAALQRIADRLDAEAEED